VLGALVRPCLATFPRLRTDQHDHTRSITFPDLARKQHSLSLKLVRYERYSRQ